MLEDNEENFTTYEEDIITLLNKLSDTIETFNTLSREQAENAILETNIKMSSCKEILNKMETHINGLNDEDTERTELNKKLLNYKTEYHEILNKFNEIQDNYINKKAENALMEHTEENLVDEDENKNRNTMESALGAGNPHMVDGVLDDEDKKIKKEKKNIKDKKENENNIENNNNNSMKKSKIMTNNNDTKNEISLIMVSNNNNIMGYNLSPNKEKDETFKQINQDYDTKKKKMVIMCVLICIFIFFLIFLIALLSK